MRKFIRLYVSISKFLRKKMIGDWFKYNDTPEMSLLFTLDSHVLRLICSKLEYNDRIVFNEIYLSKDRYVERLTIDYLRDMENIIFPQDDKIIKRCLLQMIKISNRIMETESRYERINICLPIFSYIIRPNTCKVLKLYAPFKDMVIQQSQTFAADPVIINGESEYAIRLGYLCKTCEKMYA